MKTPSFESGFYTEIFHENIFAEELLLPWLTYDYLKRNLGLGKRGRGIIRKSLQYQIKTYGDLTYLALMANVLKRRYVLGDSSGKKDRRRVRMLFLRLSEPDNYPEFSNPFSQAAQIVFDGLLAYVKREMSAAKGENLTVRDVVMGEQALNRMLSDKKVKECLRRSREKLPSLQ